MGLDAKRVTRFYRFDSHVHRRSLDFQPRCSIAPSTLSKASTCRSSGHGWIAVIHCRSFFVLIDEADESLRLGRSPNG